MKARSIVKGLLTYVPGSSYLLRRGEKLAPRSALYCYGVWIKHLTMLSRNAGLTRVPETVAELGPGYSLGVGLATLLSGANHYYALDVFRYAHRDASLKVFDDLVRLFQTRASSPAEGFPNFWQYLDDDLFPHQILTDAVLANALEPSRVAAIRRALQGEKVNCISVEYMVPWSDDSVVRPASVDLVLSHSVMEHVADPEAAYCAINCWLKPGGLMSHQIDFTSHGLSKAWNGYRADSELIWKVMFGRRAFMINRVPSSEHHRLVRRSGFDVLCYLQNFRTDGIGRAKLARKWRSLSDDDLNCAGAFLQASKT